MEFIKLLASLFAISSLKKKVEAKLKIFLDI